MQAERYSGDVVREVAESAARELGYAHMKSEQLRVVEAFVQGRDVFAILPTGYLRLFLTAIVSNYRWYSNYDYVITFLQYKSRSRMHA